MPALNAWNCPVTVVKNAGPGTDIEAFTSELEAVKGMIDSGSLGGRFGWGTPEHKAALDRVEAHLSKVRADITAEEERKALTAGRAS